MKISLTLSALALSAASFCFASDLPSVTILATGGTIAGSAKSSAQTTGYQAGAIAIQDLIDAVPALKDVAVVNGEQIAKIGSQNMTNEILLKLAKRINELLKDPKVSGIVITHGTDTLEETAYFLNLTVHSDKPVVLVGSMRPATAISADGPMNLLNAVRVAADPNSKGRGVLVVMNDKIDGARDVMKTNTINVATFDSPELGHIGLMEEGKPVYYKQTTRRHTQNSEFDLSNVTDLPRVDIVHSYVNADRMAADAAVKAGAKGIIHAGPGNGAVPEAVVPVLADAAKNGIVVVRSSRTGSGPATVSKKRWVDLGFLNSGTLTPQKARILLQVALTKTQDPKELKRIFNEY